MATVDIQELLGLSEDLAVTRHQRSVNEERLRWLAGTLGVGAFASLLYNLFYAQWPQLAAPILLLAIVRVTFQQREESAGVGVPQLLLSLAALLALAPFLLDDVAFGWTLVGFLGPFVIAAFRLPLAWTVLALVAIWAGSIGGLIAAGAIDTQQLPVPRLAIQTFLTLLTVYLTQRGTRLDHDHFLRVFKIEVSRHRERQRMREELSSARQIQLSMLPRRDPRVEGLEIAAVSLPAAEVGGDYYEYFTQGDGTLGIVVADVAGHGVASGLMLSGVRSCLHLLHLERYSAQTIVAKLDRMVRETTQRRLFITLLYTTFDLERRRLVLANAGHPPPLHVHTDGTVEFLELPAPPLGTRLDHEFREKQVSFRTGDLFVLYSDGLSEVVDAHGDYYGMDRLAERIRRIDRDRPARDIREAILSDVWNFKGNAEQHDDITLVVLKVTDPAAVSA